MPKRTLRVIHTSDVHLDSTAKNGDVEGYRNVAEHAFARVVAAVVSEHPDLFLIVGDLFDHAKVKYEDFEFVQQQLDRVTCPTVLIPGNHDVHDATSLWRKFNPDELGDRVHSIMCHEGEVIQFPEIEATLWGKAMDEHSPQFKPLGGIREMSEDHWNVGLAHGQVVEQRVNGSSSQITRGEIEHSGFDYIALGHVHVWQTYEYGNVQACYSGSPVAAFASSHGGFYASVTLDSESGIAIEKKKIQSRGKQENVVTHGVFF